MNTRRKYYMPEVNVKTIGNAAQSNDTLTIDASQFYSTAGEDGVIFINLDKENNENRIVEELDTLILQEEDKVTGYNINRIQQLLNMLPFEEKRIEMTYRKDEILKSLKVQEELQDIEKSINDEDSIVKVEDMLAITNKYMGIKKMDKNNSLKQLEDNLIRLHNDKFEELLNKENYSFESINDSIAKYEELKDYILKLQKNIKFVYNNGLKDVIMDEIASMDDIRSNIASKLMELLNCDESSLEEAIKVQRFITTINNNYNPEETDNALIENNFVDYINLGKKRRKKALIMFVEMNNKKYTTIEGVNKDLDLIVQEMKKQSTTTDTIEFKI